MFKLVALTLWLIEQRNRQEQFYGKVEKTRLLITSIVRGSSEEIQRSVSLQLAACTVYQTRSYVSFRH